MKAFALLLLILASAIPLSAQKYFTRTGKIAFESDAPLEKIEALNHSATSVIDLESGRIEFAVLIKAFQFEKALMQEHFNENYMESSQFPKAKFKGRLLDHPQHDFTVDGTYPVKVAGDLTIHGVTQALEVEGELVVAKGELSVFSNFEIAVADYDIEIPAVVRDNIAKTVRINVAIDNYQLLKEKG